MDSCVLRAVKGHVGSTWVDIRGQDMRDLSVCLLLIWKRSLVENNTISSDRILHECRNCVRIIVMGRSMAGGHELPCRGLVVASLNESLRLWFDRWIDGNSMESMIGGRKQWRSQLAIAFSALLTLEATHLQFNRLIRRFTMVSRNGQGWAYYS